MLFTAIMLKILNNVSNDTQGFPLINSFQEEIPLYTRCDINSGGN